MKLISQCALLALTLLPTALLAQQVLPIPVTNTVPPAEEKVIMQWGGKTIVGVTQPTIEVYLPTEELNTGTAIILCPGGGMRALSWSNDVERMARFLNDRGIAAIGLKYRLNNTPMQMGGQMPPLVDVTS